MELSTCSSRHCDGSPRDCSTALSMATAGTATDTRCRKPATTICEQPVTVLPPTSRADTCRQVRSQQAVNESLPRPQRPHRPRRLRHAGLHPADRHLALHHRLRERRQRRRPGRHRHRAARPEPRLVHVPARLVRLRPGQRHRPRRADAVPDHRQLPERRRLVA